MNPTKEIIAKPARDISSNSVISIIGLYELTKPRLSILSVFTASLGYLVHDPFRNDFSILLCLIFGTAFSAAGAAVLNQWMEKDEDAMMTRTRGRPIPAKLVTPNFALVFGLFLSIFGLGILFSGTNLWATLLTLCTLLIYLAFYTPLKKKSHWAIEVGAVSGALPPLVGWVAAAGSPTTYGWILFGILFTWQLPHFMAIAWKFRRDYSMGGFKLHRFGDTDGNDLSRKSFLYTILLTVFVFLPFFLNTNQSSPGTFFLLSATALSFYLLLPAGRFFLSSNRDFHANKLFIVTIVYLPLLFSALVIDRYL